MVLGRETSFEFDGEWLEQVEDYYLCKVDTDAVATSGRTELEQRVFTAQRWWSVAELDKTVEVVYPDGLAQLMADFLASE